MRFASRWHYQLARAALFFGRRERAAAFLRQALEQDPSFALAARSLAFLYASSAQPERAIAQFEAAIALAPNDAPTLFNLGFVHHGRGDYGAAVSAFDRSLALDPYLDRAWYGKGLALRSLGQLDAAAASLRKAGELQPMNSHAWYELGLTHYMMKNYGKLQEVLEYLNGFDPKMTMQLMRDTPDRPNAADNKAA